MNANSLVSKDLDAVCAAAIHALQADGSVRYADVRYVHETTERLKVRDTGPEAVSSHESRGIAVRVLGTRTWGFACTADLSERAVLEAVSTAIAVAKASSALAAGTVPFPERTAQTGAYATPLVRDPFTVSLSDKIAQLEAPVRALLGSGSPIRSAEASMTWTRLEKRLCSTEGTNVSQRFVYGSAEIAVVASNDEGLSQRRSYPCAGAQAFQGGYERLVDLDLTGNAPRLREEVIALLSAPPCPSGVRDLILESSQVALQVHESCGHPAELDRALGTEISLAGGSFLQPEHLGRLRYGSSIVNLVADAQSPGGLGTFGWDDEGVPAGTHPLVKDGLFVDFLSSRETAAALGRESTGTMRAESWNRTPLIRMVNVSLQPGSGSLEDIVADTKDGVLMATNRSWSIDDLRLDFQFSCEIAWEIKNGKRTRILRDPLYTGITPRFWGGCDAIAGREEWQIWGIQNCGKGDPMQVMQVAHGAAPARFRNVEIRCTGGSS
jgi:TldD protein